MSRHGYRAILLKASELRFGRARQRSSSCGASQWAAKEREAVFVAPGSAPIGDAVDRARSAYSCRRPKQCKTSCPNVMVRSLSTSAPVILTTNTSHT